MKNVSSYLVICSLILLGLCSSCQREEGKIAAINLENPSPEDEVKIGFRLQEQILRDTHNFPAFYGQSPESKEKLLTYLSSLLRTIAITAPVDAVNRVTYEWNVNVINDRHQHLFAAPGGNFFIYTGLLKSLRNEAELISMMAHELEYVNNKSLTKRLGKEFGGTKMGDLVLGERVVQIDNMALWLRDHSYSEEDVINADSFAIEVLCPFDYVNTSLGTIITHLDTLNMPGEEVMWIEKRPRSHETIQTLGEFEMDCGLNEHDYTERYMEMMETI